jgi:hypothetical protein
MGRQEVPPVRTLASGTAIFHPSRDSKRLRFELVVRNITNVTQAHIHLGRKGINGPVVVLLFSPSIFGISVRRGIIRGVITQSDLVGPLAGKSIAKLISEFQKGNAYVNVHTIQNPNGEIRGQIKTQ